MFRGLSGGNGNSSLLRLSRFRWSRLVELSLVAVLLSVILTELRSPAPTRRSREPVVSRFDVQQGLPPDMHAQDWSPDGRLLATGHPDGFVIWNSRTRQLVNRIMFPAEEHGVTSMMFAPDGKTLAVVQGSCRLTFWDVAGGAQSIAPLSIDDGCFEDVAFSDAHTLVATAKTDRSSAEDHYEAIVWDLTTEVPTRKHRFSIDWPRAMCIDANRSQAILGLFDGRLLVFDIETGHIESEVEVPGCEYICSLALAPEHRWLAVGSFATGVYVVGLDDFEILHHIEPDSDPRPVTYLDFSPDESTVVVVWFDGPQEFYETESWRAFSVSPIPDFGCWPPYGTHATYFAYSREQSRLRAVELEPTGDSVE